MRLCANVPAQHAIQTALGGYQSISEFIIPGGRLYEQRNRALGAYQRYSGRLLREAKKARCICSRKSTPNASIFMTTRKWCSTSLLQEKVLLVQGTAFNWPWAGSRTHRDPAARRRPGDGYLPLWPLPLRLPSALIAPPPAFASGGDPCAQWNPMLSLIKGPYESESFLCPPLPPETD